MFGGFCAASSAKITVGELTRLARQNCRRVTAAAGMDAVCFSSPRLILSVRYAGSCVGATKNAVSMTAATTCRGISCIFCSSHRCITPSRSISRTRGKTKVGLAIRNGNEEGKI